MEEWTAGKLVGISGSYWQACALHAAVKLDLFTKIGEGERNVREIAGDPGYDLRGTTALLNALSAMGLLVKNGEGYSNTEGSKEYLDKDSPKYLGHIIMHHHHLVEAWARLDQAVRKGEPIEKRSAPEEVMRESFLVGMFNMAMAIAPRLSDEIDLRGRNHLLDLGGGPGTYAIHFCLKNPGLKATVYDLPTTEPFARKTIERFGLSERIHFMAGDYLEDGIEGEYDVAWLSHILHSEGPDACEMIIEKSVASLEEGGLLLVHDFILEETLDAPLFPALFSLNMLVNTKEGRSYSEEQVKAMLAKAGLKNIQRLPFEGPNESGIITGAL
ncbi:MAG: methyltransferase [Desulfatiglandaceae bacterium]